MPLELFRNHRFAVINLATFLIYGALYVYLGYSAIFVQGTLGYSVGCGLAHRPAGRHPAERPVDEGRAGWPAGWGRAGSSSPAR